MVHPEGLLERIGRLPALSDIRYLNVSSYYNTTGDINLFQARVRFGFPAIYETVETLVYDATLDLLHGFIEDVTGAPRFARLKHLAS